MRICYLTPEYPPGPSGGIGPAIAHRARGLVAAGHEVHVVGAGTDLQLDDRGVQVHLERVAHPPRTGWFVVRRRLQARLRALVADRGIEVVVSPDWTGVAAGIDPRCARVVECHGSATYFGDELHEPVRWSVRAAERRAVRRADAVTSVSAYVAERTMALLDHAGPVPTVPNGIDTTAFAHVDATARDDATVLHVGTIVRKKGVLDLARAMRRLHETHATARLQVVGRDAPDRATRSASTWALAADELGPAMAVTDFVGPAPWDRLADIYGRASVLLVPSHAEAQPLVWLEAMSTGLPVVAYDLPWAREVVEPGRTGLLVPPGDAKALAPAVARLLDDTSLRHRLGDAAARRARRRFDLAELVPRLEASYRDAIQAARCGRDRRDVPA